MTTNFDPSNPVPALKDFQADFQPTVSDINAIHGTRNEEEKNQDESKIREMENKTFKHPWSAPWFECKDLLKYHVDNPGETFPRLARQYDSVVTVWRENYKFGQKIKRNRKLKMPPFARLDQACNGDLEASNARRRKHLVGVVAYCWQLRQICDAEQEWLRRKKHTITAKKVKKEKKKKDKDSKNKSKTDAKEEEAEEEEEEEEEAIEEDVEPNPYDWGDFTPTSLYTSFMTGLLGVFYICLCGVLPIDEVFGELYYQKKYDAVHVFANHMAKLAILRTSGGEPLIKMIMNMIRTGYTAVDFLFTHSLHSCINFESKHSTHSLKEQAAQLEATITELPPTSSKKLQKLAQLQLIDKELKEVAVLNDGFIQLMKQKAVQFRTHKQSGHVRPYPDHVYLRVFHSLQLLSPIKFLEGWGITQDDYNRIWRKIDNGDLHNNLRRIICSAVSDKAKAASAMDIDHHKLGIGPDYIKKRYSDLFEAYNRQRHENQIHDDTVAGLLEDNTDFLNHYGTVLDVDSPDETLELKEDAINTTMFAHKYLSGQINIDVAEQKEEKEDAKKDDEKAIEDTETDLSTFIDPNKAEKIEKVEELPKHPPKLQQLIRRKERLLVGMSKEYGLKQDEVKTMLELTDGRAVALSPEEFYTFYGNQPAELINKFMDKKLNQKDRESMTQYLKTILDSYRRIQIEKMKVLDPAKHFGSLRSAVHAHQQAAMERIEYAKKKYTDQYFENVQRECDEYETKLQEKKNAERIERRQRIDAIKKLERKKRERLTTPIRHTGARASKEQILSVSEQHQLDSLKQNEETIEKNAEIIKHNIMIKERNEDILESFFDAEDRKLRSMNTMEAKEDRLMGVAPDNSKNEVGMQGFLQRETNINFGKMVAAKTDINPIAEQVVTKQMERIRRRTSSRLILYTQEQLALDPYVNSSPGLDQKSLPSIHPNPPNMTPSKSAGAADMSSKSLQQRSVEDSQEKLQKLLMSIASQKEITNDMRMDAQKLLNSTSMDNMHPPMHATLRQRSLSPSPMMDESGDDEVDGVAPRHHKSNSVVIHQQSKTMVIDEEALDHINGTPYDHKEDTENEEDDELKKDILEEDEYDDDKDPYKLPFPDIDIVETDLTWLDTDELVPISHKEMLNANEIARLKVKDVPDYDVIRSDGLEQRERQIAVDKYEKSEMADAALKSAKDKHKDMMQQRLDEQKQMMQQQDEKKDVDFDILQQSRVIRQKKTKEEAAAELAALTPDERAARRAARKERNRFESRNAQLLETLDDRVEEETVMVTVEIDEFELIPIEETQEGQQLAESMAYVHEMEQKYGGDLVLDDISSDEDFGDGGGGPAVDKRQQMIYNMGTKQMYEYVVNKTGMKEEIACKILENGLNGQMVEIAVMDNELDVVLNDIGFEFKHVSRLVKVLLFDGWKQKQAYPISMNMDHFAQWIERICGKNMLNALVNNGLNGRSIAVCIEDGAHGLKETLIDAGIRDEKEIAQFRSQFVLDSNMVQCWDVDDVCTWLKQKLKNIDDAIGKLRSNKVNGSKLLGLLHEIPCTELSALGIDQVIQSKIRGKMNGICKHIRGMDHTEIMYWIHAIPIQENDEIAEILYQQEIDGGVLVDNESNLKAFLQSILQSITPNSIEEVCIVISNVLQANGGFVPMYLIQDPNIVDFNMKWSGSGGAHMFCTEEERLEYEEAKKERKLRKLQEKKDILKDAKRRHSRVESKMELGPMITQSDGRRYIRVYKGKKKVKQAQKIKNYSKRTITLEKARNEEQKKIRLARKQKYEKRRKEKQARHRAVATVIQSQLEHGITEANEMIGIHDDSDDDFSDQFSDASITDSEEELERSLMITHTSRMSTSRIAERLDLVEPQSADHLMAKKAKGKITMAGHALEEFVQGKDGAQLFHKRRASSIVQRIVAKSQNDLANYKMRRGSRRLSRRSLSRNLSGAGHGGGSLSASAKHSRGFSSGHFVTEFFKSATDRQKIEAGMRGEAPLIVYYCDKDEHTQEIKDIYQTSVLDTYIDDYSTFDDYIKILSMRLEHAQKKHRTEMDELRRSKEDLTNCVEGLRTKKHEIIRMIAQELSLVGKEKPLLDRAKVEARATQDQYNMAEDVIRDKFNETKLHVMMMLQFRDNHLRKLEEERAKSSSIKAKIRVIQGAIEELLSHYFTLQNAHNKLEHSVALLSELTTLCHEVNVRKKSEYEREIKDLLAMIERYRCRIRNVDRLISQYEKEVVELRMTHERRSAEFKKIQKNPTSNRTAATIDYYVAQRKLYEEKTEQQDNTFDDFVSVTQRYTKELTTKQTALNHYTRRSQLADAKFKQSVQRKNVLYKECRELCKSLNISWKEAEREYIAKGNELAQQFHSQYESMLQFQQESKPFGYEFVDAPSAALSKDALLESFDPVLSNKTHEELAKEEEYLMQGHIDRMESDIVANKQQLADYNKIDVAHTFNVNNSANSEIIAKQMAVLHRGDPNMDTWRAPGVRNMEEHPDDALGRTFQAVDNVYYDQHGRDPEMLVNIENSQIEEGPSDDDDDDDEDDDEEEENEEEHHTNEDDEEPSPSSRSRIMSQAPRHLSQQKSVHFKARDVAAFINK